MARKAESGFTLLELTVALLITGLAALAVASALAAVSAGWDRGERRVAERIAARALDRLRRELAALSQGPFGARPGLSGDRETMRWIATGDRGPYQAELSFIGGSLVLTLSDPRRAEPPAAITLMEGLAEAAISYFDPSGRSWRDDWLPDLRRRPPSLVRLQLALAGRDGLRRLAPLVFPIYSGRTFSAGEVDPLD